MVILDALIMEANSFLLSMTDRAHLAGDLRMSDPQVDEPLEKRAL